MHSLFGRRTALLAAAVAALLPFALPHPAVADGDASTGVAVARLSLIDGSVAVRRGDSDAPIAAAINAPVLGGDYLSTGDGSRAELQIDGSTLVRLGKNVQMRVTHLDNDNRALQLAQGTIELRLLRGTDGRSDIDTPSVTVRPTSAGSYRVAVSGDGVTFVTVRSGSVAIVTPQGERSLGTGVTLVAQGPSSSPAITEQDAIALDEFDRFNHDRDERYERALADEPYVSRDLAGVDDLNTYGRWVPDATYGELWVPAGVAPGWAPYTQGRWVWEDGFGWTWVGIEPWGWAPYHYGAWYRSPIYGWCWYPPRRNAVAAWSPALVAFFAFGGGSSFGFGYGSGFNLGWVPLAPFEPWHPWWGPHWGGTTIVSNTTVVNNTMNTYYGNAYVNNGEITRFYKNARYGVVTVPGQRFLEGRFDHPRIVQAAQLPAVRVMRGALPVVPTAANLRYTDRPIAPQLAVQDPAVHRTFAGASIPVTRLPFEQQRAAIATATHQRYTQAPATDSWSRFAPPPGSHAGAVRGYDRSGSQTITTTTPASANVPAHAQRVMQSRAPAAGSDPWSRFSAARGEADAHPVPVFDGGSGRTRTYEASGTVRARGAETNAPPVRVHTFETTTAPAAAGTTAAPPVRRGLSASAVETRRTPSYVLPDAGSSRRHETYERSETGSPAVVTRAASAAAPRPAPAAGPAQHPPAAAVHAAVSHAATADHPR